MYNRLDKPTHIINSFSITMLAYTTSPHHRVAHVTEYHHHIVSSLNPRPSALGRDSWRGLVCGGRGFSRGGASSFIAHRLLTLTLLPVNTESWIPTGSCGNRGSPSVEGPAARGGAAYVGLCGQLQSQHPLAPTVPCVEALSMAATSWLPSSDMPVF